MVKTYTLTLIKSISGIRGTIGGLAGQGLSPLDIVKFTAAFATWAMRHSSHKTIVIGRDARISGDMVRNLVCGTLQGMGITIIDLGLSTTPTVEIAVMAESAAGGIIITASHNPTEWNALKLLNAAGEFVSARDGADILELAESGAINFAAVHELGQIYFDDSYLQKHIDLVLALPLVDVKAIRQANFSVVLDAVNSTGGIFVPALLKALGVLKVEELYCTPDGNFQHNPEPVPENLTALSAKVIETGADMGISVDPDVDRLVFVSEDGSMFGEEYTLVAVSDFVLGHTPGNTVSNLSSTRALDDVTLNHKGVYYAAAVGEVNVVTRMKEVHAVIGGEGNGGVIYPAIHYGRDALVGIALFLTHLAHKGQKMTALKNSYPAYYISKNKINLTDATDVDAMLLLFTEKYKNNKLNTEDGIRIDYEKEWVHLRKSNTEAIIRIIAESATKASAEALAGRIISELNAMMS